MHLYWGKRLSDPAISWYLEAPYRRKKLLEGTEPDDPMFLHEFWPYEYPEYGMSDYRPAALEVVGQDGCCISELRYEDYEILEGSVELPGLPSVWAEKEDAQTLKLILKDQILQLQAELYYTVFENTGAITRHTVLKNLGKDSLKIKKALSMSLDMKHAPYEMLQLSGTALREHWIERRKLGIGETYLESTRGISSHQENPFFGTGRKGNDRTKRRCLRCNASLQRKLFGRGILRYVPQCQSTDWNSSGKLWMEVGSRRGICNSTGSSVLLSKRT